MIIGQFGETYPPETDGVGRVMEAYCRTLTQMGHTSYYAAPSDGRHGAADCNYLLYCGVRLPKRPYRAGIPELDAACRRRLKDIHFDIVHAHTPFLSGHAARRLARKNGIPLAATFHSRYFDDLMRATHSAFLTRCALRSIVKFYDSCDEVFTMNTRSAALLRSYGYRGDITIVPHGAEAHTPDAEAYARSISRFGVKADIPLLLYVGQMDFKKNIALILNAAAILKTDGGDFLLLLVGSGIDEAGILRLIGRLGLSENVRCPGFVSDADELFSLYKRADLFVFPSEYDTFSMVVREAAAMGTASVVLKNSCAAEGITDGFNGFFCENTPESLAAAINSALPRAAAVGKTAGMTVPQSWDAVMRGVAARYEELIKNNVGRVSTECRRRLW